LSKERPDHSDAELLLRVYDLRREEVMRNSRTLINRDFWPKTWEDVQAVLKGDHPLNAAYRQTGSYWEMVYSFVRHGIVNPVFWIENNGEGLFLFARIEPYLEQIRAATSPNSFKSAEWIARECAETKPLYAGYAARVRKMAESR
jgi:hypothetical protein